MCTSADFSVIDMICAAVRRGYEAGIDGPILLSSELRALSSKQLEALSWAIINMNLGENWLIVGDVQGILLPPFAAVTDDVCPGDRICADWPFGAVYVEIAETLRSDEYVRTLHVSDTGYWSGEIVLYGEMNLLLYFYTV